MNRLSRRRLPMLALAAIASTLKQSYPYGRVDPDPPMGERMTNAELMIFLHTVQLKVINAQIGVLMRPKPDPHIPDERGNV